MLDTFAKMSLLEKKVSQEEKLLSQMKDIKYLYDPLLIK